MKHIFVVAYCLDTTTDEDDCFPVGVFSTEAAMKQACQAFGKSVCDNDVAVAFEAIFVEIDKGLLYNDVKNATIIDDVPPCLN